MRYVVGVFRFLYDFVVGDDLVTAVGVISLMAAIALIAHHGHPGVWWLAPAGVVVILATSLWRATRPEA